MISSKLYRLALWYIGKCSNEEKKKYKTYKNEVKKLERLTFKNVGNVDKAYLIYGCDAQWQNFSRYEVLDNAIQRLAEYEALGTVEELKEAREKQVAKKPIEYEDKYYACPRCEGTVMYKWDEYPTKLKSKKYGLPYCLGCGQK